MLVKFNKISAYTSQDIIDEGDKFLSKKGIYKFYIKEDRLKELINNSDLESNLKKYLLKDFKIFDKSETLSMDDIKYYCIYVGKADKRFRTRVINHHIRNTWKSTLRTSLKAFNYDDDKLKVLFNDINSENFIFELKNVDNEIEVEEFKEINNKFHLLNLRDNGYYFKKTDLIKILLNIRELRRIKAKQEKAKQG